MTQGTAEPQWHIVLLIKNHMIRAACEELLAGLGHDVVGSYVDDKAYTNHVPLIVKPIEVVITDYASEAVVKQINRVLHSRHSVAAIILVGNDRSLFYACEEENIFGRVPLPLSALSLQGALIVATMALRLLRSQAQAAVADERHQKEIAEFEQAIDIMMELKPKPCPTRPDARRYILDIVTSWQFQLVTYVRRLIEFYLYLEPKKGKPDNKRSKKPPG